MLGDEQTPVPSGGMVNLPQQGADLMPRVAVCVTVLSREGGEYRLETPSPSTPWAYTVRLAKELKGEKFPGYAAPQFLFEMAQSVNLLPYVFGEHRALIALPAERDASGTWHVLSDEEIRHRGYIYTARRFKKVNSRLGELANHKTLQERIDERGKLSKQKFGDDGFLLLVGAGGMRVCAACIPASDAAELVLDQTLYWKHIPIEEEVWYCVGMLNSLALTEAITPFNPQGNFGARHIHTLPYRLMPEFDATNEEHTRISHLAGNVAGIAEDIVSADCYLNDPNRQLHIRRSRLRQALDQESKVSELEYCCAGQLGVSLNFEEGNGV